MTILGGLSRWKPRHLLAAWSAYWVGLVVVTLGPAIVSLLRVALPAGAKGSASASVGDAGMHLEVIRQGATVWAGSARYVPVALWLAVPPLLLWLAWMAARPKRALAVTQDDSPARMLSGEPFSLYDREKPKREMIDRD
jgi:hypothetical protein